MTSKYRLSENFDKGEMYTVGIDYNELPDEGMWHYNAIEFHGENLEEVLTRAMICLRALRMEYDK